MIQEARSMAGLRTVVITPLTPAHLSVVMLHGYAMTPEDLAPFGFSLGVPARFYLPEGPVEATPSGRAWWQMDHEGRPTALATAQPRDLASKRPEGAPAARACLMTFLDAVRNETGLPQVLVGFSQGGMLACDTVLRERLEIAGLALLSSSRITAQEWEPLVNHLRNLPVLVSHGRTDPDLAFSAGEALRDLLLAGGAQVQWVPFDQGHEIPLVVWRSLRKFLSALT